MQRQPTDQACPYCGAQIGLLVDPSDDGMQYTEDCQVCCQPILIRPQMDAEGQLIDITLRREDD